MVAESAPTTCTTFLHRPWRFRPIVVRTLAEMMQRAGKEVSIGEGSAAAPKFNVVGKEIFQRRKREILE